MNQDFEVLLEESLATINLIPGNLIPAVIVDIDKDWVTLHAGLKSESIIARGEFEESGKEFNFNIGDTVELYLEKFDDGQGNTKLSRIKAVQEQTWKRLDDAVENQVNVKGFVLEQIKGGFSVDISGLKAFLPGSLVESYSDSKMPDISNQTLDFKVIKLDKLRQNIVLSRKAVVNAVSEDEMANLIDKLKLGGVVRGVVKTITNYGAFVDLGGIDGLLHITDISWSRINHPTDVLKSNVEIDVLVLHFDEERRRVSLGLKQLTKDPWEEAIQNYPIGTEIEAKITNITDFGCFAEIIEGIEGLVHVSELDWGNRNINPKNVLKVGSKVKVKILAADFSRNRLSLSLKQCTENPWLKFNEKHKKSDIITAPIRSITDFGLFIGLEGDIDGLIHITDLPEYGTEDDILLLKKYKNGDDVTASISNIDVERERISLSIKDIANKKIAELLSNISRDDIVKVKVTKINKSSIDVELSEEISVRLKADVLPKLIKEQTFEDLYKVGEYTEALVRNVRVKLGQIKLSIRDLDAVKNKKVLTEINERAQTESSTESIGDLIKAKLNKDNE